MTKVGKQFMAVAVVFVAFPVSQASAYEAGDWIVRAGVATVEPDESSGGVNVPALAGTGTYVGGPIAGTGVEVGSDTQLGLTATYMVDHQWGVEVLAATPFTHDITANLGGLGKVNAGEATHLPPTVSLVWYPVGAAAGVAPYVGAGLNYTIFFDEKVSSDLENGLPSVADAITEDAVGLTAPVEMDLHLDDSVGIALQVGLDVAMDEQWHVNASVRWIDINTEATLTSALGDTITVDDIEIDPWVYQVNVGYRF